MRPAHAIVLLGVASAVAGCGASPSVEVQAKLQQFARAVAHHDATTICRQVLAPTLVDRFAAAGLDCNQAMRVYFQSVSQPRLAVSAVHVHGSTASAVVVASARAQPADRETVHLVDTKAGWRLASLASPR